jgi:uncharacterized protein (TIGR03437 family)
MCKLRALAMPAACILFFASLLGAQGVITTVAGTTWRFTGDGGPATNAPLGELRGITVDAAGNLFAADIDNDIVVKISPAGILTVVAGNGTQGFSGDGGPATGAQLYNPHGVALDATGNLYIAHRSNHRIRKVSPTGMMTTIAGTGTSGFSGDGGPAISASLSDPTGVAVDAVGNIYVADCWNHRIRRVSPDGTITTVAGNGTAGYSGDGGPATLASLNNPVHIAVDAAGSLYIADTSNNRIRKIPRGGVITTVAGNGTCGFSGDLGPAVSASLCSPESVTLDAAGSLYIADMSNHRIRMVGSTGIISTVTGNGTAGFSGDAGPALNASFYNPWGVAVDIAGSVYVTDSLNRRVRKFTPGGSISTVAGNGLCKAPTDGVPATSSFLNQPWDVAADGAGNIYIVDGYNERVRKVSPAGVITTVAGNGVRGFSGDGGPAAAASLGFVPYGSVAVDPGGNLYISDSNNHRVRKVTPGGIISTVAGNGAAGFSGDGGPATQASLNWPWRLALDAAGSLYVADRSNYRVRRVSPAGIITTVAGNGMRGFSGDGGPATSASLVDPMGVAVDTAGNLYISEYEGQRVRRVSPSGVISTVAGTGAWGSLGDGGPATAASLGGPFAVTVDRTGNLLVADTDNHRVRKVDPTGIITTMAGSGSWGYSGDGGISLSASLNKPTAVAVDSAGNLYIADRNNDRIRKVLATPPAFSVASTKLSFSAPAGTPVVAAQQIATSSPITGLVWRVEASTEDGAPWLGFSPPVGLAPAPVTVSVNVADLKPGNYRGTVTVQAPLGAVPTQSVAVELTVTVPIPPKLVVEPSGLNFEILIGKGNPPARSLRISNGGDGVIKWTAQAGMASGGNWLQVSPASGSASGSAPASVQVSVDVAGLNPGVYTGSVRIESAAVNQVQTVPVTFLLTRPIPTILVSQSGLSFTGVAGGTIVPAQSLGILNVGQGVMSWTVQATTLSGGNWLSVSPTSGSSTADSLEIPMVDVAVNVSGLAAGTYDGLLRVTAAGANNTPQLVPVALNVLPAGSNPGVLVRPTGLIFATRVATSSPAQQSVKLATPVPGTLGFVQGLLTYDGGTWLEAGTGNSMLSPDNPAAVSVGPALGKLAAGIYRGALALLFGDGSSQTVNILFLVTRSGAAASALRNTPQEAGPDCVPSRLLAQIRSASSKLGEPTGFPTLLEAQVVDDCGVAAPNAVVVASFSNGDPPLVLTSLRNGIYMGTWRPLSQGAQVTVIIRAMQPPLLPADVTARTSVVTAGGLPVIFPGGVVDGASFAPGAPLAPGGIISVFGASLATATASATRLPLETVLGNASLNIGGRDAPLFYSSNGQINAQLPFDLEPNSRPGVVLKTRRQGATQDTYAVPETITVTTVQPTIFTTNQQGTGQGAILDKNNKLVDASAPARAGDAVQVFCTGLGATQPAVASGAPAPATPPLAQVIAPVTATVGGKPAAVQFAGLAPNFVGLYQVNVQIPEGVAAGSAVPLVLYQNGIASNTVTLALR